MYLMNTRPYIRFAINTLIHFLTNARHVHLIAAKHILRYLKGVVYYGIKYDVNRKINLHGYVDLDWVGRSIDRKSTSGCFFSLGSSMISWFNKNQSCVALSTAEAEYVAACSASCEALWLRKVLFNLFDLQLETTCIYCDNQSCMKLSEKPMFHDKSKHIEIKFHYIKDMLQRGSLNL